MGLFDFLFRKEEESLDEQYQLQKEEDEQREVSKGYFSMVVEDVFTITGRGTVATGTVEVGSVSVGDVVYLTNSETGIERKVIITGIEKFRATLETAVEGDIVGLLLKNVKRNEVSKGDILHK
jgi:elongation factor Tu